MNILPCPNCNGTPHFDYKHTYGHGDSGYTNARMQCSCGVSFGDEYGYGRPESDVELDVVNKWNNFVSKLTGKTIPHNEIEETPDGTPPYAQKLYKEFSQPMSALEFLKKLDYILKFGSPDEKSEDTK